MQEITEHRLPVLAVDIGGTKILSAIISSEGEIIAREYRLALADEGPQAVINRVLLAIDHTLDQSNMELCDLDSISIAAAGAIDYEKGLSLIHISEPTRPY